MDNYKYLGVTLNPYLNYDHYLSTVIHKITYKSFLLRKIRRYIDVRSSLYVYKSMILPYVEYGDFLYHAASKKKIDKLQIIQNQNLKLCLNLNPRHNNLESHRLANLNFLEDRRNVHLLSFMYLKSRSPLHTDNRNTRKYDYILVPPYIKAKSQRAAWYRGASAWNELEPEMRAIETYHKFKAKQKYLMKRLLL